MDDRHIPCVTKVSYMCSVQAPAFINPFANSAKKRVFPLRPSLPVYDNGTAYTRDDYPLKSPGL
jgi:hypothetical protein